MWTPTGNKIQTEIDISIAKLENIMSRVFLDISCARKDLALTEDFIYELYNCLEHLKSKGIIVSVSEFYLIRKQYDSSKKVKDTIKNNLEILNDKIDKLETEISALKDIRKRAETKILRFTDVPKREPKIETDKDYIMSKKHDNSLSALIKDYPNGVPDKVICKVLQISQEELDEIYNRAIINIKNQMN